MELMSIGKFAKLVGVHTATLRTMDKEGTLKPVHVSDGGTRYYSTEQLNAFHIGETKNHSKKVVGYARVSTKSQADDLQTQVNNISTYLLAKGYQYEVITDIGSGINYHNKGLQQLIKMIHDQEVSKVVILYKDRLVRFGFELIEYLCELNDVTIEIIDNTDRTKEEELTEDLIQIITVFANRLYGSRSKKTKRLLDEVRADDHIS